MLAFRNIRKNKGSKTAGTNKHDILKIGRENPKNLVEYVRHRLLDFKPHSVKRVEIDKEDGKKRPLGIPTIEDRLIQQCIKQVLEPICEAKFHPHSYGFRPNRSTSHALARTMFLTNIGKFRYVADIDIKGFFDNVSHAKLIKQMWSLGIRDKNLICVIGKMLKAEIKGIGVPAKGVPQGGILSPLLSNIVLNELDWWISNQWATVKTRKDYTPSGKRSVLGNYTNLKQVHIVRYADDFRLFCKNADEANRIFEATRMWLKERLELEINPKKSKIVNLKKQYSEFLGFKMKLHQKSHKWVIKSHISDKAKNRAQEKIKNQIKKLQKESKAPNVQQYNACVLGLQNYYKYATNANLDFADIAYVLNKILKFRLRKRFSKKGIKSKAFEKYYKNSNWKVYYVDKIALFQIPVVKHKNPMCFQQEVCNYTAEGRAKIHEMQNAVSDKVLKHIMRNPVIWQTSEYNDNRISLYVGQMGKCGVSHKPLEIGEMHVHHKTPKEYGGKDDYKNLIFVSTYVHMLIHAKTEDTVQKYFKMLKLDTKAIAKLNKLRLLAQNYEIDIVTSY